MRCAPTATLHVVGKPESIVGMTLLKTSGVCASASVFSLLPVFVQGDGVCPGYLSTCFIAAFFCSV